MDTINVGTTANDGTGDNLRAAMVKINSNFEEIHRENLIIDGQFNHWDEGIGPFTASADNTATMAFCNNAANGGTGWARATFTMGQTDVPYNPVYYMTSNNDAASTTVLLQKRMIGLQATANKECTVSVWLKGSVAGDIRFRITQSFGTGGSPSAVIQASSIVHTVTTSWVKYTHTFTFPDITGKTLGTNGDEHITFAIDQKFGTATFEGTLDYSNIAMVYGSVAYDQPFPTPAEERHRIDEYYQIIGDYEEGVAGSKYIELLCRQAGTPDTARKSMIDLRRKMRDVPNVTAGTPSGGTIDSISATTNIIRINGTSGGTSQAQTLDYIIADARL